MESRTEVLVIGGGSTGTGVARDLAIRGLDVTLVERGTLTHGATGRMHGLLHSGGRYAVADPTSARECIRENRILRDVAGHCVAETGGVFVERPEDPDGYFEQKLDACRDCGIPATVLSGETAREREPSLAADVERAIAVPDAVVDPVRLCVANAASAARRGARIETHAAVADLLVEGGRVVGALVDHGTDSDKHGTGSPGARERIRADHVVNATGAWAGRVAGMAGADVEMSPSKGVMTVVDFGGVDAVLNRCRPKGNGDIVVPHRTSCVLGTTDEPVGDPDDYDEEQWEIDLVRDELSDLVPALASAPVVRSFWGVRPLYEPPESDAADPTDASRGFTVLDHADRDGRPGLTTVVGGKLTTYRLMAERVADLVCGRLGVEADCETASVPLLGSEDRSVLRDYTADFGLESPGGPPGVEGDRFSG